MLSEGVSETRRTWSQCASSESELDEDIIQSRPPRRYLTYLEKMSFMKCWNVAGALVSPIGMTKKLKGPHIGSETWSSTPGPAMIRMCCSILHVGRISCKSSWKPSWSMRFCDQRNGISILFGVILLRFSEVNTESESSILSFWQKRNWCTPRGHLRSRNKTPFLTYHLGTHVGSQVSVARQRNKMWL